MKKRKLGLIVIASLLFAGAVAFALNSKPTMVKAEEEQTTEVVEEEPQEETEKEKNTLADKLLSFKDTFLVPIVSTISLTSVSAAVVSIAVALINRKTNKLIKNSNDQTQAAAVKMMEDTQDLIDSALSVLRNQEKIASRTAILLEKNEKISEETKNAIIEQTREFKEKGEKLFNELEKVLGLKQCVLLLIGLNSEMAKGNPQLISTGAIEKINELNEQAKKII